MDNLHRSLAPISAAAWDEIEEEARRTFARYVAGRRIVDMPPARGLEFAALSTGRTTDCDSRIPGVRTRRREAIPVVELRVPFTVDRTEVDDVARGSVDSDWQPVKDAATAMAQAEDDAVFVGSTVSGITGIVTAASNEPIELPDDISAFPHVVATALTTLRLVGVDGPYALLLSADLYRLVSETTDHGFPIRDHIRRVLGEDGSIVWAPGLSGALVVSERGGDFELHLGQDLAIGYLGHDADTVELYLEESFTFRVASDEAAVAIR